MESEILNSEDSNMSLLELLTAPDFTPLQNPYHACATSSSYHADYNHHHLHPPPPPEFSPPLSTFAEPEFLTLETFLAPPPLLLKCPKLEHSPPPEPQCDNYSLGSIVNECLRIPASGRKRQTVAVAEGGKKRKGMDEKRWALSKVLPGGYGYKKSTVEMLEVTRKYIQFLQAQVKALQSMPPAAARLSEGVGVGGGGGGGREERLGRLTRQQMLQVVVNSEKGQIEMAERGLCVVSAEQVDYLKRVEARNYFVQQLLSHLPL